MGNVGKIITETEKRKISFSLLSVCTQPEAAQALRDPSPFVLLENTEGIRSGVADAIQRIPFLRLLVAVGLCFVC